MFLSSLNRDVSVSIQNEHLNFRMTWIFSNIFERSIIYSVHMNIYKFYLYHKINYL